MEQQDLQWRRAARTDDAGGELVVRALGPRDLLEEGLHRGRARRRERGHPAARLVPGELHSLVLVDVPPVRRDVLPRAADVAPHAVRAAALDDVRLAVAEAAEAVPHEIAVVNPARVRGGTAERRGEVFCQRTRDKSVRNARRWRGLPLLFQGFAADQRQN